MQFNLIASYFEADKIYAHGRIYISDRKSGKRIMENRFSIYRVIDFCYSQNPHTAKNASQSTSCLLAPKTAPFISLIITYICTAYILRVAIDKLLPMCVLSRTQIAVSCALLSVRFWQQLIMKSCLRTRIFSRTFNDTNVTEFFSACATLLPPQEQTKLLLFLATSLSRVSDKINISPH